MTITSSHNEKLKTLRKLRQRRRDRDRLGQFVAEGEDLLAAADAAGWVPVERFAVSGSGLPGIEVDAAALKSVTELASGTRTLAIYSERWEASVGVTQSGLVLYLHGVSDPGNVGTVLRSAAAFGASCVALGPGSADPFSPKAVRASMGAIFSVPVARASPGQLPGTTIALDAGAERELSAVAADLVPQAEISVLIGAEREGLPAEVIAACEHAARIPIASESLNAAIAASLALYELRRIRPA
ncbi:MAG: RNA methyltransferase [Acidobacteriota bacterium]|nr:RNA methyltransferase [Acidobacteriota bacterium]